MSRGRKSVPSTTNKANFACFRCRKAFKQAGSSAWDATVTDRPYPCPNCKAPMTRFGKYFKAPPSRARRQWLKVELLHRFGERFVSSSLGLGTKCRDLPSTVLYLVEQGNGESEVHLQLEHLQALRAPQR